jgi:hypothetical protein
MLFLYASCLAGIELVPKLTKNTAPPKIQLRWRCQFHQHFTCSLFMPIYFFQKKFHHTIIIQTKTKIPILFNSICSVLSNLRLIVYNIVYFSTYFLTKKCLLPYTMLDLLTNIILIC